MQQNLQQSRAKYAGQKYIFDKHCCLGEVSNGAEGIIKEMVVLWQGGTDMGVKICRL